MTLEKAMQSVVDNLCSMKPHEVGNHVVVFDKFSDRRHIMMFSRPDNADSYESQLMYFGRALKENGIEAKFVVFVINGLMPHNMLRPVSVIVAMERGGECKQVVLDYKDGNRVLPSDRISEKDREVCAYLFMAQASYHPAEEHSAKWN